MCHDTGAYMMNFRGCIKCQRTDALLVAERTESEIDNEELIEYKRKLTILSCSNCFLHLSLCKILCCF